jgi:hypothetical protein
MMTSWLIVCLSIFTSTASGAAPDSVPNSTPTATPKNAAAVPIANPAAVPAKDSQERNFYEVLNDVIEDFAYDIKNGNITGLKEISIRNIATSENIPPSFKNHLELLMTEQILKNSKTHMIQCLPCKSRKTSINGDQVVITSTDSNPAELARIAKMSGIEHFMDIAFQYEPSGIMISMFITEPESGNILWSRSYNSETSRAAAFRKGIDYDQIDEARKSTEYAPLIQSRLILYYLFEPDLPSQSGCLSLGYRMVERYDNRKKEVGFEADYLVSSSTIINSVGASSQGIYNAFGLNLTLLFMHTWNFIGEEENYNKIRTNISAGIGGTYSSGFLGGLVRLGYEWRMAKHFGVSAILGYRPPGSAFIAGTATGSVSGLEYGLGVNVLF